MSMRTRSSLDGTRQRHVANSTPVSGSTPSSTGFYHLRERLEKQLSNSQINKDKQVSPTLEKLQMTPGRVLKDREVLTGKHLHVRQKADKLRVGGGVSLWPGMDDMRLSRREIIELLLVSVALVPAVIYGFNKLHGTTIGELQKFYSSLKDFHGNHQISVTSFMSSDLRNWHKDYRLLLDQIHASFDMSKVPLMYVMYIMVYTVGMGALIYFLVDNMLAKSKLSPNRIKEWVSILVVISTWTGALFYFLVHAYLVEKSIEENIAKLTTLLGECISRDVDGTVVSHMVSYWGAISRTGTLNVLGLVSIYDLMHYLQYYFIPIMTILLTPVIKLIMSVYTLYSTPR